MPSDVITPPPVSARIILHGTAPLSQPRHVSAQPAFIARKPLLPERHAYSGSHLPATFSPPPTHSTTRYPYFGSTAPALFSSTFPSTTTSASSFLSTAPASSPTIPSFVTTSESPLLSLLLNASTVDYAMPTTAKGFLPNSEIASFPFMTDPEIKETDSASLSAPGLNSPTFIQSSKWVSSLFYLVYI